MLGPVALLTDFGLVDPFVGIMKGVILSRYSKAVVVDITHHVPPQDVRAGAFALMSSIPFFPLNTIFVAVVDPGVGSGRRILWARSKKRQFLAPDNGMLAWVERIGPFDEVRSVSNERLFLRPVSATFHGRDIFAPIAAYLEGGGSPAKLGPRVRDWTRLPFPEIARSRSGRRGTVLAVDRFGNAVTNLPVASDGVVYRHRGRSVGPLKPYYAAVAPGTPLAVTGSAGFVELSIRNGDFAKRFGAKVGDVVEACNEF